MSLNYKTNHEKSLFILLLILTTVSCNHNKSIEGSIFIKLIDVHNIYGMSQEKFDKFKIRINNSDQSKYSNSEQDLIKHYKILIENDLFNKPSFKLKMNSGEIINVFTNETEYLKLKKELTDLNKEKESILVKFNGKKISNGIFEEAIYSASNITSVIKITGKTDWKK